jgi:signal transduction histidine kinase
MEETDLTRSSQLPTLKEWRILEANRFLLASRFQIASILFKVVAVAILFFYAPTALILLWIALIFSTKYLMRYLITAYAALLKSTPKPVVMTAPMAEIVQQYKMVWLTNCFVWGGLSFMSQMWLPTILRLICITLVNLLMLLSITRTYVDRKLMHQASAILVASQLVFVMMRLVLQGSGDGSDVVVTQVAIYMVYLVLMSYLLWTVGNLFHRMYLKRLCSEYTNLQLQERLNQYKTQLQKEQQALLASNRVVQPFYAGNRHDLCQPVFAMQLYASMMRDDPSLGKVLLPKIVQSCVSINDMFNTLFDYQQMRMYGTDRPESCAQPLASDF